MRRDIIRIEDALAETLKFRAGGLCDIVVTLNLAAMAADIERALS